MIEFTAEFENEKGEEVTVSVVYHEDVVTVNVTRPTSRTDAAWSRLEMAAVRALLNPAQIEPAYKPRSIQPE